MTAPHCGYCGRPLPAAAAPPGGGLAPPPPGGRPAYPPASSGPPAAKTIMGYGPPPGMPAVPPWGQQPQRPGQPPGSAPPAPPSSAPPSAPSAPPSGGFAPPPPSGPPGGAPPSYGSPPGAPPAGYGQPPGAPPGYGAPPPGYGAPPPGYGPPPGQPPGAPPAYAPQGFVPPPPQGAPGQPPFAAPPQPGYPPQPAYGAQPQPGGYGAPAAQTGWPPPATTESLFGVPLSLLRDQAFEGKVLLFSALALVVTRFLPVAHGGGEFVFNWSDPIGPGLFRGMIWPLLVAAVYAGIRFLPPHVRQQIPAPVTKWGPFVLAYISTGMYFIALPILTASTLAFGARGGVGPTGALIWAYPILVFGLLVRMQDPGDIIARGLIAVGAFLSLLGGLINVGDLFEFGNTPALIVIHNLLFLVVILLMLGSVVFAPTQQMFPQLAQFERYLPTVTMILVAWLPVAAFLVCLSYITTDVLATLLILVHVIVLQVAFFGVLLLTAPEAMDTLKKIFKPGPGMQPPPGGGYGQPPPPGYGQPPPPGYGQPPPPGYGQPPPGQGGGWPPPR